MPANNNHFGSYLGNRRLKRTGEKIEFTTEQIQEYVKCKNDIIHFIEEYCKIVHVDRGLVPFKLYDYQKETIKRLNNHRANVLGYCRQSGKSITTAAFILHFILFHDYKTVGIVANKGATSREILSRIQLAYENLPKWLQQGVEEWNKGSIALENGSRVLAAATSSSAIRGQSLSYLFVDEVAFIDNSVWDEFYSSVYPTISSGKETRITLVSTPNGLNHFYKIWSDAEEGKNEFVPTKVIWSDVPGRDETWKKETIRNTSEEAFAQEHCMVFLGNANTLISPHVLSNLAVKDPINEDISMGLKIYKYPEEEHIYILVADVSRGVGLDYHAFSVIDITSYPFEQVATFRNNTMPPMVYPGTIYKVATDYNTAYVLVESNDLGESILDILNFDLEYENIITSPSSKTDMNQYKLGTRTTKLVKRLGCSNLKDLLDNNKLIINDFNTIEEMSGFIQKGVSYEADTGFHDDIVMGLVLFSWFIKQELFSAIQGSNSSIRKSLYGQNAKDMYESLTPVGFFDDGVNVEANDDSSPIVVNPNNISPDDKEFLR